MLNDCLLRKQLEYKPKEFILFYSYSCSRTETYYKESSLIYIHNENVFKFILGTLSIYNNTNYWIEIDLNLYSHINTVLNLYIYLYLYIYNNTYIYIYSISFLARSNRCIQIHAPFYLLPQNIFKQGERKLMR